MFALTLVTGIVICLSAEFAIIAEAKSAATTRVLFGRAIEPTMAMVLTRMTNDTNVPHCATVKAEILFTTHRRHHHHHPIFYKIGCYNPNIRSCVAIIPSNSLCSEEDIRDETMELCGGGIKFSPLKYTPSRLKFVSSRDVRRYLVIHINCTGENMKVYTPAKYTYVSVEKQITNKQVKYIAFLIVG